MHWSNPLFIASSSFAIGMILSFFLTSYGLFRLQRRAKRNSNKLWTQKKGKRIMIHPMRRYNINMETGEAEPIPGYEERFPKHLKKNPEVSKEGNELFATLLNSGLLPFSAISGVA